MTTIAHVPKQILISSDLSELRVAVLEEGRASEVYIERRGEGSIAGNIYKAKVDNVLRGMEAAFIELGLPKNGFLHVDDVMLPGQDTSSRRKKKIDELLKPGQEVLVQVVKNPMGTKGARVTMELSIAGRFLVLTPGGEGAGVSKRLPDAERERLRKLVKQLELEDEGVIARTAAEGATMEDLERDLRFLRKIWAQIETRAKTAKTPSLVFREADLSLRVIRDVLSRNVEEVLVDSERQYRRILGFVRTTQPELAERIKLYSGAKPMFERYGVEAAIRSTLNRRVDLPSGGYLIFDYAEAFTVIDVNTGRFVGKTGRLEDTITKNNIEAAREVMRQLRLRDIGGIIVIDFIDMEKSKNRAEVLSVLQAELAKDRTKTYLVEISPLGLVEMTRQNVTEGVRELLTSICPACGGEGRVLSLDTMAVEAERKLRKLARAATADAMLIKLNAKVASRLVGPGGERLIELERETGRWFTLEADGRLPLEELDVVREGTRDEIDGATPVKAGEEVSVKIAEPHQFNLSDGVARVGSYPVVIGGGISYVGQDHKVRIERASRTTAYATLLDAKPKALEIPQDPAEFEIPEFEREIGERLELEDRSRNRRGRTARTPKKPAEAKPAASRSRAKATADTEPEAEAAEAAAAEAPVEGEEAAAAKPKRRRGTRGGRSRTKKTTAAASANGDEPEASAEAAAPEAEEKPAPKPRRRRAPAKPKAETETAEVASSANGDEPEAKPKPRRRTRSTAKPKTEEAPAAEAPPAPEPAPAAAAEATPEPKRSGGLFSRLLGE